MINGIRNKIVTSIYSLNYINERGGGTYKGFDLLTQTIRNIIFEEYEYVIYTDYSSYEKFNLGKIFDRPNITIKFRELNSEYYLNFLNDLRLKRVSEGEIWDRIHSVENYIEVILNKLQFLIDESNNFDGNVIWIDSGLLGTSCSNAWRDYMNVVCHTKDFLDAIFSNIQSYNFICLKGNNILINYEVKQKLSSLVSKDFKIVPGALFGGKSEYVLNYLTNYKEMMNSIVNVCGSYTSEQELLSILLDEKEHKYFDFDDWDDLQRGILKLMGIYDEDTYQTNTFSFDNSDEDTLLSFGANVVNQSDFTEEEIQFTYPLSDEEILKHIINVSNNTLNKLDLSHHSFMLNKMSSFAKYYHYPAGAEHYRLLTYISKLYDGEIICDVGTNNGCSALALSENSNNIVKTFDIVDYKEPDTLIKDNIIFFLDDVMKYEEVLKQTRLIFLDANHDGIFEKKIYDKLKEVNFKGILLLDDIHLNDNMKSFWGSIPEEKYDLSIKGHNTGTGLVFLN